MIIENTRVQVGKEVKKLYGRLEYDDQAKVDAIIEQSKLLIADILQRAQAQVDKVQDSTAKKVRKVAIISKQKVEKFAKSIHADIDVSATKWDDEYEGSLELPKGLAIDGEIHARDYFGDSMAEIWYQIYQDLKMVSPCEPHCEWCQAGNVL